MSDIRSMPYVTVEQVHRFREAALAEIAAIRSQLEAMQWIKTTDRLPELNEAEIAYGASHIDCWIFVNGMVGDLPFNVHHQCWDDDQYDDFKFAATKPTHWMRRVDPLPPVPDKQKV